MLFLKYPCLFSVARVEKEIGGMEMAHEGMIWSLAWHPLGHILCSGSNDHTRLVSAAVDRELSHNTVARFTS